ncbi:LIM and calponin homology domains-containing protein 1, partial [Lates japonicus]
ERRILEETVTPLTPRSSALPSPSRGELSSTSEPQDTIVRSLADWERKQELLERQSRGSTESMEGKRRENDRTSDISTADDSMKTGRSLGSQSTSQPETLGHSLQNGQKPPPMPAKSSTPMKKQDHTADSNRPSRPAGDRRSGPIDNNMSRSSSKPPAACPPTPDTLPPAPNRSVSGKKLCSSCGQPLGKGAAMIIETLSLYFHIHCFKEQPANESRSVIFWASAQPGSCHHAVNLSPLVRISKIPVVLAVLRVRPCYSTTPAQTSTWFGHLKVKKVRRNVLKCTALYSGLLLWSLRIPGIQTVRDGREWPREVVTVGIMPNPLKPATELQNHTRDHLTRIQPAAMASLSLEGPARQVGKHSARLSAAPVIRLAGAAAGCLPDTLFGCWLFTLRRCRLLSVKSDVAIF